MCNQSGNTMAVLFRKPIFGFILTLLGMSAAYFTTIGSIRMSLAEKAESELVDVIDKRITRLEVVITEGMITKDNFFEFKEDIESRLSRIEYHLVENRGDKGEGR